MFRRLATSKLQPTLAIRQLPIFFNTEGSIDLILISVSLPAPVLCRQIHLAYFHNGRFIFQLFLLFVPSLFLLHDLGLFASNSMEFISVGLNYFLSDRKVIVYKSWGDLSQFRDVTLNNLGGRIVTQGKNIQGARSKDGQKMLGGLRPLPLRFRHPCNYCNAKHAYLDWHRIII